ncbi:MAG: hypothetical protein V5A43_01540 [Haloarculaceae archaeon]
MDRGLSVAIAATVALVLLGGCLGAPGAQDSATSPGFSTTPPLQHPEFDAHTIDTNPGEPAVIEGGISVSPDDLDAGSGQYYATTVTDRAEADARFDTTALDEEGRSFVEATEFEDSFLVVVQVFPHSSVPDHRVESVRREDGALSIAVNDSSLGGTDDITLETVLVRVGGRAPDSVTITTEESDSWQAGEGVVNGTTGRQTTIPPATDQPVDLPYRGDDPGENVDDPRDLVVENRGNATAGYRLELEYLEIPECRNETPPCGMPTREVAVLRETGKIRAGGTERFADVAARRGQYTVAVAAEVPTANGSLRTLRASTHRTLDETAPDVHVAIRDGEIRFVTPASTDTEAS